MDILFLSNVLPYPLDAGPKVRSYYVLRYLAQYHRVTLLAHTRAGDTPAAIEHLRSFCHAVHPVPITRSRVQDARHLASSLVSAKPFLVLRDDLASMRAAMANVTAQQQFDAVHADQLSTAPYALALAKLRRVLDQHNAVWTIVERLARNETFLPKRWLLKRETRLLQHHEAAMGQAFDQVITVTEQDRRALEFPDAPTRAPMLTIPICIDPNDVVPVKRNAKAQNIACVGGMFYPPNVDGVLWFARQVLPRVWNEFPHTKFFIVGSRPARELVRLGEREPRIVVTGYVADTRPYLADSAAFVVPLRAGGGMRVKILDAWARALPVVTTTIGGEGISVRHGENVLVADTPDAFAQAIIQLLRDPAAADQLARAGRAWVETAYHWRTIYRAFDVVYPHPSSGKKSLDG
jgi:glycosyltransferase involved in cell wall biosynthesis